MPKILPISDLRNYTRVLSQVDVDKSVYLTRNGRGTYVISKLDDYDREATAEELLKGIKDAEKYSHGKKSLSIKEVAKSFNIEL
jgi:PHD/YefM family antitoxin component YafN of YafNO toxin-antitoxin module